MHKEHLTYGHGDVLPNLYPGNSREKVALAFNGETLNVHDKPAILWLTEGIMAQPAFRWRDKKSHYQAQLTMLGAIQDIPTFRATSPDDVVMPIATGITEEGQRVRVNALFHVRKYISPFEEFSLGIEVGGETGIIGSLELQQEHQMRRQTQADQFMMEVINAIPIDDENGLTSRL